MKLIQPYMHLARTVCPDNWYTGFNLSNKLGENKNSLNRNI